MKYMILTYGSQQDYDGLSGKAADGESAWTPGLFAKMAEFMQALSQELTDSGELVETRALVAPVHTRRISSAVGKPVVTDGPYAETEEVLAGYWIVECESFDRATAIAARLNDCPGPEGVTAFADVRPVAESQDGIDF